MKEKKWIILTEDYERVSNWLDSFEIAKDLYDNLNGLYKEYIICETVYG